MRQYVLLVACSLALLVFVANPTLAAITTGGSVWQNTYADGRVYYRIGQSANGWMIMDGGSTLTHHGVLMGGDYGRTGEATVDGVGTVWTSTIERRLGIGNDGVAIIHIINGATINDAYTAIGSSPYRTKGTINVDGQGSHLSTNVLAVGEQGSGTLNITNGADVQVGLMARMGQGSPWVQNYTEYSVINVQDLGSRLIIGGELRMGVVSSGWGEHHVTMNITDGGYVRLGGDLELGHGSLSTAIVNIDGGTLDMQGHSITRGAGTSEFNFTSGTIANVGGFTGGLHQKGGRLAAGGSPGTMPIGGDYILDSGAVLEVEVGNINLGAGIGYDFYDVVGTATLSGTLDALPYAGFTKNIGDTVDVLTATSIDTTGLTITNGDLFAYDVVAGGNGEILQLTIIPEPAAGVLLLAGLPALFPRRRVS